MHKRTLHGAVAFATRIKAELSGTKVDGQQCREEEVGLRLETGEVWVVDLFVPLGAPSITFANAARSLRRQQRSKRDGGLWRLAASPALFRTPGTPA